MDYHKEYKKYFNDSYQKYEVKIKDELIEGAEASYSFEATFEKISNFLYRDKNQLKSKIKSYKLEKSIYEFENWLGNYQKNKSIELVINRDCLREFNESKKKQPELIKIKFESFLKDFAGFNSLMTIIETLYEHKTELKKIFAKKNFEVFNLKSNMHPWEKSKAKLDNRINDINNITNNLPSIDIPPIKNLNREQIKFADILNTFDNNEKTFLLNIIYELPKAGNNRHRGLSLPLTEFLKLIVITKDITDIDLFYKSPGRITYYNNISQGIEKIDRHKRSEFISKLSHKLKKLNLGKTSELVIEYHSTK